ncbi:helix-hairpin-helix domain-containing protein [Bradyrhizobium sp. SZCCHNPS1003]|uniref:helix-hairpin-helix domain-containing protein n=1 Tax=Bradyrhizobium sp. SZCCHNPS1003 TaxID=3057330 RepID=UPI0028E526C5|nr:helix-hairpin-helix domain-containing protein [Bradyrhizobium sp. SZCCHNPS1003]
MPVQNAEIAKMFDQAAELLEIKGRSRAYRNAARLIECLPKSITGLLKAGEDLSELPGIGKDLAGKIETIVAALPCFLWCCSGSEVRSSGPPCELGGCLVVAPSTIVTCNPRCTFLAWRSGFAYFSLWQGIA